MLAPALVDHYLAHTTFGGQSRPDPVRPDRLDNLFDAVPGRHAVRGSFSREAKDGAVRLPDGTARVLAAVGLVGLTALAGLAVGRGVTGR